MSYKVSVILPFFNAESFLQKAIESILNQDYSDFELILINNNSTDKSVKIASPFAKKYKNVKLYHENKQGVVFASKLGLLKSTGKYIARMDADDIAFPQKLRLQNEFLDKNPNIQAIASLVKYHSNMPNTEGFERFVNWSNSVQTCREITLSRFIEFPVVNPTLMFRREVIEEHGFYKNGDFPEDYELFLRWIENGVKFAKINEYLLQWNDSKNRLTRTDTIYSAESFYKIKAKYLANWLKKQGHTKIAVWGAGKRPRKRSKFLVDFGIEISFYIDIIKDRVIPKPCIFYEDTPKAGTIFIVSYIAKEVARKEIATFLNSRNYKQGEDYILAG